MDWVRKGTWTDHQKTESPYKTCWKQWFLGQKGVQIKYPINPVENDRLCPKEDPNIYNNAKSPIKPVII